MANIPYSLAKAFAAIENQLINSMIRNMKRHRAEETDEGIQWSQWQAEQLKALEEYRKANKQNFGERFEVLNGRIEELLRAANETGMMDQEEAILKAIQNGFTGYEKADAGITGKFFRTNERKLNTLVNATTNDMQKAETAVLRMANDQYRKIIFNAQVYANTGAGTYEQAVDMATKDMLSAGLNCVQYANGSRHTLADYADMAIKTANKRAYLQGEGTKRKEWGTHLVIMAKRGNPCPKCLPFVGKILIDDVWSGGSKGDGDYPLMSKAIEAGLYHPRCKDSHTTYFPGITTAKGEWTKGELEAIGQSNKEEARQQYAERQEEKYNRLAEGSLDPENQASYSAKADEWKLGQKNRGEKVFITDQAIDKVGIVPIDQTSSDELREIQEMNKVILRTAMNQNNSNEVAMLWKSGEGVGHPVLGEKGSVDFLSDPEMSHTLRSSPMRSIVLSHNHPGLTYFSCDDLGVFLSYPSIKTIMIVTNMGKVYQLTKKDGYQDEQMIEHYWDIIGKNPGAKIDKIVALFLESTYKYIERKG